MREWTWSIGTVTGQRRRRTGGSVIAIRRAHGSGHRPGWRRMRGTQWTGEIGHVRMASCRTRTGHLMADLLVRLRPAARDARLSSHRLIGAQRRGWRVAIPRRSDAIACDEPQGRRSRPASAGTSRPPNNLPGARVPRDHLVRSSIHRSHAPECKFGRGSGASLRTRGRCSRARSDRSGGRQRRRSRRSA